MRVSFVIHPPEGALFAPEAFEKQIGKTTSFAGHPATILSAVVDADGSSAEIEVECPELAEHTSLYWDITRGLVG
jgi:hypothetical protein